MTWKAVFLTALTIATSGALSAHATTWDPYAWNPPGADGQERLADLVLPLPCDGAIAFMAVAARMPNSGSGVEELDDRRVTIGSRSGETPFVDFARTVHIDGPFQGPGNARIYFIGKYEVTQAQYRAVMSDTCPEPDIETDSLPAFGVSWYDSAEFFRRLNGFWYREHLDKLPTRNGTPGFARLPTETEWEFAARGGASVTEIEFAAPRFPFAQGAELHQYAHYGDTISASGEVQEIGSVLPNPLGLYDMLGNVAEMVSDTFQLNKTGRPHGLAGGLIVKGGSFLSEARNVESSTRVEYPVYNGRTRDEQRSDDVGFRAALGAVALPDRAIYDTLSADWQVSTAEEGPEDAQPRDSLRLLSEETTDLALRSRLQGIEALILDLDRQRDEARDRLIETALIGAVAQHVTLCSSKKLLDRTRRSLVTIRATQESSSDPAFYDSIIVEQENKARDSLREVQEISEPYVTQLIRFRDDGDISGLLARGNELVGEFISRNRLVYAAHTRGYLTILEEFSTLQTSAVADVLGLVDTQFADICPEA